MDETLRISWPMLLFHLFWIVGAALILAAFSHREFIAARAKRKSTGIQPSKWLKVLMGMTVTGLALWLSFRHLEWKVLAVTLIRINPFWAILALGNSLFTVYALGWRWRLLLKPEGSIPLSSLFRLNIISQYANIIMPARLGEVARVYLATQQHRLSAAFVAGTVVIEKLLDFFVFVALWVIVPAVFALQEKVRGYKIALLLGVGMLGLLAAIIFRPSSFLKILERLSPIFPQRFRSRFVDFFKRGFEAFHQLRSPKILAGLFSLTIIFIVSQVLTNYLLFKAFQMPLSFWAALFLLLAVQVGNIPPSAPGKVGVFEYAVILALSVFHIPRSQALSFGLTLHLIAFLPKIVLGLVYLTAMDISLRKSYIRKANGNEKKV